MTEKAQGDVCGEGGGGGEGEFVLLYVEHKYFFIYG